MAGIAGRTAGFGRIGGEFRPSSFTPVHLPSTPLVAAAAGHRARFGHRVAVGVVVALVVAAAAFIAGVIAKGRTAPATTLEALNETLPALDAEAERLGRSAFASQRRGDG